MDTSANNDASQVEGVLLDAQPLVDQQLPTPAPQAPVFKMFVSFAVATGTGQVFGSMILTGIPDIVTSADVENIQRTIAQQMKAQAVSLMFWRHLYA